MTRKVLVVAALAALMLPATTLHAQLGFGVAGGLSVPMNDFEDFVSSGYHVTGLVSLNIPLAPFGFRAEGSFSEFDYKGGVLANGAKARIISGTANGIVATPGIISTYFIAGVGVYHSTAECTGCTASSTKIGFNGGGGVKFGLSGFAAFIEARYVFLTGESEATTINVNRTTQFIPISVGISF